MKPEKNKETTQLELFKSELINLVDPSHPLVILSKKIDWEGFEEKFGKLYHPSFGRPGYSPCRIFSS